ncbi:MAG: nucleotide exchange factor GrpE [Clostridiales bacterium]
MGSNSTENNKEKKANEEEKNNIENKDLDKTENNNNVVQDDIKVNSSEKLNSNEINEDDKYNKKDKKDRKDKKDKKDRKDKKDKEKIEKLESEIKEVNKKKDEYLYLLQSKAAEFENFRKRTIKEKDELYSRAFSESIELFLPLIDNFDRAVLAMLEEDSSKESIREGVEMIYKQLKELLKNVGVEEIKTEGKTFDPKFHNAMMHIEDDKFGENVIVEEFQKGFKYKGKVIRHSAVKVAN